MILTCLYLTGCGREEVGESLEQRGGQRQSPADRTAP